MELIDFHVAQCRDGFGEQCRWLETSGRRDMVVILTRPRRHSPPSLTHLARLAVNTRLADLHLPSRSTDLLPVPQAIKNYLREYPYKVWTSAPLHVQVPCVARCRCTGLRARIHRKAAGLQHPESAAARSTRHGLVSLTRLPDQGWNMCVMGAAWRERERLFPLPAAPDQVTM